MLEQEMSAAHLIFSWQRCRTARAFSICTIHWAQKFPREEAAVGSSKSLQNHTMGILQGICIPFFSKAFWICFLMCFLAVLFPNFH